MRPKLTGQRSQCMACLLLFARVSTFDAHRVGRGVTRRCLSVPELERLGWQRDAGDFWRTTPRPS
jgi:hypothetical protein